MRIAFHTTLLFITLLLISLMFNGAITTAIAQDTGGTMTNIAPANPADPIIGGALAAADSYWSRMGFQTTTPNVFLYDDSDTDVRARADMPGDNLWITRQVLATTTWKFSGATNPSRRTRLDRQFRRMMLVEFAATITHDRGHNLGLDHTDWRPIMHHDRSRRDAPREAYEWALKLVPEPLRHQ